jgi:hypothetical protein
MPVRSRVIPSALIAVLSAYAAGCASAHAKAPPEIPPLEMPPPPERLMATSDADQPPPAGLIEEPARHAMPDSVRRPATVKPDAGREEAPKVEVAPPAPPEPVKPAEESKPSTTLQMPMSVSDTEAERNIQALLARANDSLGRVNTKSLNADALTQYQMVQGYVRSANEALHQKNLVYALKLADRAAVLAAQLAGK